MQGRTFEFDLKLTNRYPLVEPQLNLITANLPLQLNDGRDLYNELVGKHGWKQECSVAQLIAQIPDFTAEILLSQATNLVIGKFHLGQLYDLNAYPTVFDVREQSELDANKTMPRRFVITPTAMLIFRPVDDDLPQVGMLGAWAHLKSLLRVRRNPTVPQYLSLVFKKSDERQPWVLNLVV